jgi:hypothetical protein
VEEVHGHRVDPSLLSQRGQDPGDRPRQQLAALFAGESATVSITLSGGPRGGRPFRRIRHGVSSRLAVMGATTPRVNQGYPGHSPQGRVQQTRPLRARTSRHRTTSQSIPVSVNTDWAVRVRRGVAICHREVVRSVAEGSSAW